MAATTPRVTAFWGAFLNVLIRCIAALGFATPARTKAAASRQAVGYATVPAQAVATPAIPAAAPSGGYAAPPLRAGRVMLPAPRPSERGRSLPPTMKQRIRAEAHGTSPSSRSIAVPVDGLGDAVAAAAATAGAADQHDASEGSARRRDRSLCG
ncbi:DUF6344 domain-containing protein [Streptomyces cocklensis]|jgi:hypothetical protein|uniref:Uncharacterized protein n=1 Tax=Actinacidiphila cocklensis TaxID=887465 RepID=A0A9W4E5T2_9ACTN|nr:DUF6344 domain-containing protein [Actinacidiphila cocklensis]MDD1057028.1 DUF6344 domain-containing protein [Actinacidiphila cocklensis]WSX78178.1 DUF6344 domain-containing protein [Streptomyces sp. NBC_00899]CAG6393456.1 conserved hypothetical protein [Actinacidiphila cocklensis]